MKISIYKKTVIGFWVLLILASCTHYIYISRSPWQTNTIMADGKALEWAIPLKYYDEKSRLQYVVSNDSKNFYICVRATEEETQTKILRAGMQIWIDTTGKNEHRIGVLFPMANSRERFDQIQTGAKDRYVRENLEGRRIEKKNNANGLKKSFLAGYKEMELVGFKPPINGMNPIQNSYGILTNINWDSIGIMTYEAIIPFKTFYKDSISASDSLKLMGVSIILNGLPALKGSGGGADQNGSTGMPGGAGNTRMSGAGTGAGGMGGMRAGSGHSGTYSQGSNYLYETNSIKKIFQLAVKKK